ncbi:hypothetical protein SAMN05443428_11357 [Caloramator quimbayensis]|uniref:NlpC/P60 family protein n=1 Tax=Caloramator quimbayensis TaxID=1147123 RepID=A0A1T4XU94_9CLOT|nr:hypothetical protein [Caloramator quimbayensis]SKA93149.1 hypothetical protein SAMN05443428_11357 [Caloramator quimbayensis]
MRKWGRRYYFRRNKDTILNLLKLYMLFLVFIFLLTFLTVVINKPYKKTPKQPVKKVTIRDIKRSSAYKRGLDIINYVWEYNVYRNGKEDKKNIKLPSYLEDKTSVKSCGIPYCWGGFFSLDKSNDENVKNFSEAIERGYTAGNIMCSGEYKDYTAGLDCSGFVSAVYNLPEKCATYTLKDYFNTIDINDLKPMDIFNSEKNHTFIYLRESSDKKGIIAMEATTGKSKKDKTVISYKSYEEIKKGVNGEKYVPMRYKGVIDDNVELFKDINEFNDNFDFAVLTKGFITGYIEYAEDMDYFYIENERDKSINIGIKNLPSFCTVKVLDENRKEIAALGKGDYYINVKKGKTYLLIEGSDFRFSSEEGYEIYIR